MDTLNAAALGVLTSAVIFAQTPAPKLEFEVASIRPSTSDGNKVSVGLQLDGSQVHVVGLSLRDYIAMAYRVKDYQVAGPDWLPSARFDLSAKLPAGSSSDQIPEMLQAVLADRFQMKMHREKKDFPIYALIAGKPPLKLQASAASAETEPSKGAVTVAGSGSSAGISVDLGRGSYYTFVNNKFDIKKVSLDQAADILERFADRPIVNQTELTGNYDIVLNVTEDEYRNLLIRAGANSGISLPPQVLKILDDGGASPLFDAVQQVGLKLDPRKAPLDLLVIDQAQKSPSDN